MGVCLCDREREKVCERERDCVGLFCRVCRHTVQSDLSQ